MPPETGGEPLTVAQLIKDAKAIVVTTPQGIGLADVRKSINFCRTVKMDILGLVENMSGYACPHCGKPVDIFGSGGGDRTTAIPGLNLSGRIPFDPERVKSGDAGISYQHPCSNAALTRVRGYRCPDIQRGPRSKACK
jgi:Mrp family chromosome partitioning ATPase